MVSRTTMLPRHVHWPRYRWAILVLVAVLGCVSGFAWMLSTSGGRRPAPASADQGAHNASGRALLASSSGNGWATSFFASGSGWDDPLVVLQWDNDPQIQILDRLSGQQLGAIEISYRPLVLVRASAHELLVSDRPDSPAIPRLLVFDTSPDGQLHLKREIQLPDRALYTAYGGELALSQNQRYLFYPAIHSTCSGDTSTCDSWSVGIVDLTAAAPAVAFVALPPGCGWPYLGPGSNAAQALAMCTTGTSVVVDGPSAAATEPLVPTKRPTETEAVFGATPAKARFAATELNGDLVTVYSEGSVQVRDAAGNTTSTHGVPAGMRLFGDGVVYALDSQRLLIPYAQYLDEEPQGVAIFNVQTQKVERTIVLQSISAYVPDGANAILALDNDGSIDRISLVNGSSTTISAIPVQPLGALRLAP